MVIATLKEIKDNENRVGLTPAGVRELVSRGHSVLVQMSAGLGAGFPDEEYVQAGAELRETPEEIVKDVDILVKVKEPVPNEYHLLSLMKGKTLYTYLHLSGVDPKLTDVLLENEITGIAYETIMDDHDGLPCLKPMSEVAGVLAIQYAAQYLQRKYEGRGVTMGSVSGTDSAHTVIVGAGVVGKKAAKTAAGMGGRVTVFDINPQRIEGLKKELHIYLGDTLYTNVQVVLSEPAVLAEYVADADVVIGAVLVPGAKAPQVITEAHVKSMKKGSVIVDVAIDQGGCVWGSRATTHSNPIYELEGVIYCCVANMPGQVAHQSTQALTAATLPYLLEMVDKGVDATLKESCELNECRFSRGLNTYRGKVVFEAVSKDLGLEHKYQELEEALGTR